MLNIKYLNLLFFTNLVFANPEEGADKKPSVIFSPQIPLYVHFNEVSFEDLARAQQSLLISELRVSK